MSSIENLKEEARKHEQKEEWPKALDLYKRAIEKLEKEEQPDIGLYNRVADIQVRLGLIEPAVGNYEKAIDLYLEAELPNNAIAVCKKIVRNMPQRHSVYLRMGQIRGKQGLLGDARQNFLTYAERMQSEKNIDEGLRALTELADYSPDDPSIRLMIAAQMQGQGRTDDAVAQLQTGFRLASQRGLPTEQLEQMLEQLGATPDLTAPAATAASLGGPAGGLGDIMLSPPAAKKEAKEAADSGVEVGAFEISIGGPPAKEAKAEEKAEEEEELPIFGFTGADEEETEDAAPLPMLGGEEEDEAIEPLPLMGDGYSQAKPDEASLDAAAFGESDREDRDVASHVEELPALDLPISLEEPGGASAREAAMEEERPRSAPPTPSALPPRPAAGPAEPGKGPFKGVSERDPMGHEALAERGDMAGAIKALGKLTKLHPHDVGLAERMVEYATRLGDSSTLVTAWLDLGDTFKRTGQPAAATPFYQQALEVEPKNARALTALGKAPAAAPAKKAPPSEGFIDLGSMILGDDEEEKTTRFVVAFEEPTGNEQADFAKMLSQFKAKVAENLSADDVKAHQDLGTAYKEMGLIDEAIGEFQAALRASAEHLPTYEMLGQCFMEKGQPEAAVRTLTRALDAPYEVEDELLGIYYYLGRAHEQLGNTKDAVEFYDRVFTLDINFADVTERLRALR
jgi:tetratricopeptide (TPR) repeat protein